MTRINLRRLLGYADRGGIFPVYIGGDYDKAPAGTCMFPELRGKERSDATGAIVKELRDRPTKAEEILRWWTAEGTWGVGLNAGYPWHVIDFDDADAFPEWIEALAAAGANLLLGQTAIASTTSGGYHVWANVPECRDGSLKLANFAEATYDPKRGKDVLCRIETRGRGGYALIAPSPGYAWLGEMTPLDLEPMPLADWQRLVDVARSLDRSPEPQLVVQRTVEAKPRRVEVDSPVTWFNRTADWEDLLTRAGGRIFRRNARGLQVTRPGKTKGVSLTTGNWDRNNNDRASLKSPNWPGFPPGNYDKFEWFARLEHGGDKRAAAKAIQAMPAYTGIRRSA